MFLVAVDNQVPFSAIRMIEACGFHVVVRAVDHPDEEWFAKAVELGATVFVSPDHDIQQLCRQHGRTWVRLKQGLKGIEVAHYVTKKLYEIVEEQRMKAVA